MAPVIRYREYRPCIEQNRCKRAALATSSKDRFMIDVRVRRRDTFNDCRPYIQAPAAPAQSAPRLYLERCEYSLLTYFAEGFSNKYDLFKSHTHDFSVDIGYNRQHVPAPVHVGETPRDEGLFLFNRWTRTKYTNSRFLSTTFACAHLDTRQ